MMDIARLMIVDDNVKIYKVYRPKIDFGRKVYTLLAPKTNVLVKARQICM